MTAAVALSCVFGLGICFSLFGSLGVRLMPRLAIDRGRFGTLISVFMFTCLLTSLVVGVLTDRLGYKPVAAAGFLAVFLAMIGLARGRSYASIFPGCILLGIGAMALNTVGNTIIPAVLFGGKNPAGASNLGNVFFGLGLFLTPLLVSFLLRKTSYEKAVGLLGILVLVPVAPALLAEYPKIAAGFSPAEAFSLLTEPVVLAGAIVLLLYSSLETSFCNWLTPYAKEIFGRSHPESDESRADAKARGMLSFFAVAMMAGRLITSQIPAITSSGSRVVGGVMLAAAAVILGLTVVRKSGAVPILAALAGLLLGPCFPTTVGIVYAKHPDHFSAVFGVIFAGAMLGGVVVPKAIGNLAKHATLQKSLRLLIPICLGVAGCVLWLGTL
jgi:fucose permease